MRLPFCSKLETLPPFPPALNILEVHDCQGLKSLPELPSSCFNVNALHCTSLEKISNWKPPFLQEMDLDHSFIYEQSSLYVRWTTFHHVITRLLVKEKEPHGYLIMPPQDGGWNGMNPDLGSKWDE
ncbi:hypothetical protein FEM48_Zijuj11G0014100 [Ziziphus jujuba var. spinosa]|uniref:Uncharacterized protein n=1 Tax=Ziziphus jujuba var. spinosa TaxID=714518 RepID=A0A978UG15_ZIZJJ|nr:hypothetical protein FEM48_Zijuj11G0014100 [Ziziphus jujuba var. spinosa]